MSEEKIRDWVERKLQDGVSKARIKKSLAETDHDASIVDEVAESLDLEDSDEEELEPPEEDMGVNFSSDSESEKVARIEVRMPDRYTFLKILGAASVILLLIAGGSLFLGSGSSPQDLPVVGQLNGIGADRECPDVGVEIVAIKGSDSSTSAVVRVSRGKALTVLEIYRDGNLVDSKRRTVSGKEEMTVRATGDKAVFRPVYCDDIVYSLDIPG